MSGGAELSLVIIAVDDQLAAATFWQHLSGWARSVDEPGIYSEFTTPAGMRLGIYSREHYVGNLGVGRESLSGNGLQPAELYLSVTDVEYAVEQARALGGSILAEPTEKPWGDVVAYVRAPGDFVVALAAPGHP